MNTNKFRSAFKNAEFKQGGYKLVILGQWVVIVIVGLIALKDNSSVQTVITPTFVDRELSIKDGRMDVAYVEEMTKEFANKLYTYQKKSVDFQFDAFLKHVSPVNYAAIKTKLDEEKEKIKRRDLRSVFYPTGIHVIGQTGYITGQVESYIGTNFINSKDKIFEFVFDYKGTVVVEGVYEVVKVRGEYIRQDDDSQKRTLN